MWLLTILGCVAAIHVETSVPEAEVGLVSSASRPSESGLWARYRGRGEVHARVPYSVFDTWWAWARADGYDTAIVKLPTTVAAGPAVSCGAGLFMTPFLAGCFFVIRPKSGTVHIELETAEDPRNGDPVPAPDVRPPPPAITIRPTPISAE